MYISINETNQFYVHISILKYIVLISKFISKVQPVVGTCSLITDYCSKTLSYDFKSKLNFSKTLLETTI